MKAVICVWLFTSLGVRHSASVGNQNVKEKDVSVLEDTDVSKNSSSNGPSKSDCDFENGDFCNWTHGDAWSVQDGRQAMVTGREPTADHTKWDSSGRYAYFNPVNSTAFKLTSDIIDVGSSGNCFVFWYYVHSPKPVQLELYLQQYGLTKGPFWRMTTSSTKWRKAFYTLHQPAYTKLMFLPSKDDPNVGEIALDDLSVHQEGCSKQKTCKDEDAKCAYGSACEMVSGEYICTCKEGLAGDRCQAIVDCREGGKYERCPRSGHTCEFIEGKAVCVCEDGKEFAVTTEWCRRTCNYDKECSFGAKCELQLDHSFCTCPVGLTGDFCEVIIDCQHRGKFEKCTQGRGSCKFYEGKPLCECGLGKEFDVSTGQCRVTCSTSYNRCQQGTKCELQDGHSFCKCADGLSGDFCEDITDCQAGGKLEKCQATGGKCAFYKGKAVCECRKGQIFEFGECQDITTISESSTSTFHTEAPVSTELSTETTIPECDCGKGDCRFDANGTKTCLCWTGFKEKNGRCEICDCGFSAHTCHFDENGKKICTCWDEYADNDGYCTGCNCSSSLLLGCEFINGQVKCNCPQFQAQKEGKCEDCFCGLGGTCSFEENSKRCHCREGFLEDYDGYCKECNCGKNGKCSLFFGSKECECDPGFGNRNGFCEACNCGQNASCIFKPRWNNYHKSCLCPEGFQEVNQHCEEVKSTTGVEGSSTEGTIVTTTINPDCDCGLKSYKCIRGSDGDTKCICYAGYAQANGKCSECNCGKNSKLCYFDRSSKKSCICSDGYAQRNGTCTGICLSNSDCRNGGACRIGEGGSPFCACRRPYAGEWCEAHSACAGLKCEAAGAECRVRGNRAQCECPAWSWYNADFRRCEGYSKLWIVSVALFSLSALQMIFFTCYFCVCRGKEKK